MKKRLQIIAHQILIISLLVLTVACSNTQQSAKERSVPAVDAAFIGDVVVHTKLSSQARIGPQWVAPRGIGIGFVSPNERDMSPDIRTQTEEVHISEPGDFETLLILQAEKPTTVVVTALLDYKQIAFELDGMAGLLHEIAVTPEGDFEIPLKISIDAPGIHDLIVVAFADPYNSSVDPLVRSSLDIDVVGRRAQLIVGEDESISDQLPEPVRGTEIPEDVTLNLGVAFATFRANETRHPSDLDRQLYVAQGNPGDVFRFQVWASNLNGEEGSDYALMMFKNYHQVPIQTQPLTVINLQPDEEAVLDTEVTLSETPGIDQIQIVYIFDPYKSVRREEVRAAHVFSSPRLAIEVSSK